ncbi:MAG: 3'(2'),5'-bisphosphate nucleotidase CysQ [Bacteroidales bacterium]|nr:3'(2'),5'-bisphosphate nucleotidase CysQ [Bacteroidales bacterium]
MTLSQLKAYADLAAEAAVKAGQAIMEVYESPETDWEVERKADNSPLTLADRKAHAVICGYLRETPFHILSEEGRHAEYAERKDVETMWIVDPLDGTKEFLKRNGEFTVNIALCHEGSPIVGAIYVPARRQLYTGIVCADESEVFRKTLGEDFEPVSCEKLPLKGGAAQRMGGGTFVVVASRSHLSEETEQFVERMRSEHGNVELRSAGSSLKICLVAEGEADVYPRLAPTMEWDTAAGQAVAEAAGCSVTDAENGQPLRYNKEDLHNPYFIVAPKK